MELDYDGVLFFGLSWVSHESLMPPKVSFLFDEATAVNKISSTSPVHSEPTDVWETHLPTEQDSNHGPKCDAIHDEPLMASDTQRMTCGGGYRFHFPRVLDPFLAGRR
jgi:hypothetical protein